MKKFIAMVVAVLMTAGFVTASAATQAPKAQPKEKIEKVVLSVDLDKPDDAKKIQEFMPKQVGVKTINVDSRTKQATITYDENKTSPANLVKNLSKIQIKAKQYVAPAPSKK